MKGNMRWSWSFLWFHPCNLATIVLVIMVLVSCRTPTESGYHLYRAYDRNESMPSQMNTNGTIKCYRCSDGPGNSDAYLFGLAGICRERNLEIESCTSYFPAPSFTFADIAAINTTSNTTLPPSLDSIIARPPQMQKPDLDLLASMSKASAALLILSVILGFAMIPLSIFLGSGFSRYLLPLLIFDACSLLSVCGLMYAMYRTNEGSTRVDLYGKSGPGFLLLVVALVVRLLCNPALFIVVALLCLSLFLCALWCVLACVGASTPDYVEYVVYRPVGYFYD